MLITPHTSELVALLVRNTSTEARISNIDAVIATILA